MNTFQRLIDIGIVNYRPSSSIETIDLHTAGEPLRVVLAGFPPIEGRSILEKRKYCQDELDRYRQALIHEPRGHRDMYGSLLVAPDRGDSDLGVLFIHHEGYSTMCGHAIIALTQLFFEKRWKEVDGDGAFKMKFDAPCGQIISRIEDVESSNPTVSFKGVPSYLVGEQQILALSNGTTVRYQLAYGGAYYAYVDADAQGIDLKTLSSSYIRDLGMEIKRLVAATDDRIIHPLESDLSFLYGTIFTSKKSNVADSYNVCVFADGEIDRCPTGSGLSGRMAIEHFSNRLGLGDQMSVESISGGIYLAKSIHQVHFAGIPAVVPEISGTAYITGHHSFALNSDDTLGWGFTI